MFSDEKIEELVGKEVKDSSGDILEVVFIDKSVGITLACTSQDILHNGNICINGPMSPNRQSPNYESMFNNLVEMIDSGYIDLNKLMNIWSNGKRPFTGGGAAVCAVGG